MYMSRADYFWPLVSLQSFIFFFSVVAEISKITDFRLFPVVVPVSLFKLLLFVGASLFSSTICFTMLAVYASVLSFLNFFLFLRKVRLVLISFT